PPIARSRGLSRWFLLLGAVALVCIMAGRDIRKGEFDFYVDEAQHAVTGLFVADAMRDLPFRHPVQYAYRYYAQYPAVAILHWPPLFYAFEGMSFLLLGPSVVSARLTVILFTVVLLYQWFLLVEELQDSYTAGIATAVLGLLPWCFCSKRQSCWKSRRWLLVWVQFGTGSDIWTRAADVLFISLVFGSVRHSCASKPACTCWFSAD